MSWSKAIVYCQNLDENRHYDWKLPTTTELSGLNKSGGNYWASDREKIAKKYDNDEDKAWFYDFSVKKREKSFVSTNMYVVCVRNMPKQKKAKPEPPENAVNTQAQDPEDPKACETVREISKKEDNAEAWQFYIEKFPNGLCAKEAKQAINKHMMMKAKEEADALEKAKKLEEAKAKEKAAAEKEKEQKLYEKAKELNTRAAWEEYLREFHDGRNKFEAEYNKEKMKKIGNLEWSDRSPEEMTWNLAKQYCKNLKEGGFTDWRLPNIDELRTLIKNCPKTEPGGECKVSENNRCLEEKCGTSHFHSSCSCDGKSNNDGYYSKLGDDNKFWLWSSSTASKFWLWSSSTASKFWLWSYFTASKKSDVAVGSAWCVNFYSGEVYSAIKNTSGNVRCVR
jgi:hypothetical protein